MDELPIVARLRNDAPYVSRPKVAEIMTKSAALITELVEALRAMVDEQCDYMRLNTLGDPEQQHNIKRARAAIAKATP